MLQTRVNSGLDGIIVADTVMSEVDGEEGRLVVRGHALPELVATRGFEGVAALLWTDYATGGGDEAAVTKGLATARVRAFKDVPKLLAATEGLTPVEALRVGLGMLPDSRRSLSTKPGTRTRAFSSPPVSTQRPSAPTWAMPLSRSRLTATGI